MSTSGQIILCEQGSLEWKRLRCGIVTASRASDVVAMSTKGTELARRADYRSELICEILTGQPYPRFVTQAMQWGIDQEPFAHAAYEMKRDVLVETCGFVLHPDVVRFGGSPDGLVDEDGLIQIKCPNTSTHIDWLRAGTVPTEHCFQMMAEMACTGREWCDFVSFEPRLPEHLQLFVKRYERNDEMIEKFLNEVEHFNAEIDYVIRALPQKPQGIVLCMDRIAEDEVTF